jgi:hypothetical protein
MSSQDIADKLSSFECVSLGEMDNVRLMNRTDTKFIMPVTIVTDLLQSLKDYYRVLEINEQMVLSYSSTYLDTQDFLFYNQHVTSRPERSKIRYRKYEVTGEVFLEIKKRTKKGRTSKSRIEINCGEENNCSERAAVFMQEHVQVDPIHLAPILFSRFRRITLAGKDKPERLTIDIDLSFSDYSMHSIDIPYIAIAELKREGFDNNSQAADILKNLNIRSCGFSKYCTGLSLLYDLPHKNSVKPKLLLLNKIENEYFRNLRA